MRKVVAGFAISLDGKIEGPHGEYDWIVVDKEIDFAELNKRYDTYLYGRRTYESVRSMGQPPSAKDRHYVFSTSLNEVSKGFTLVKENIREEVLSLKAQPGKDIALFGGAGLLTTLLNLELVDEISMSVIPVILGSGKPMVEQLDQRVGLALSGTKTYANGTVQLTYTVRKRQ
jgi:dihydrofolate reductase